MRHFHAKRHRRAEQDADQRKRQKSVGDRGLERRLGGRLGRIDVNPLPIVGRFGKRVDPLPA